MMDSINIHYLFLYFLTYAVSVLASKPPSQIQIGLFGDKFTNYGTINVDGSECISAMLLAIDDLNNKNDGMLDGLLPTTNIKFALRQTHAEFLETSISSQEYCFDVFNGSGVIGVVGTGYDSSSKAAAMTFGNAPFKINMMDYFANDSALSHAQSFPYYSRLIPSRGYDGYAVAKFVKLFFGWSTVNVISTLDTYGTDASSEFFGEAKKLGVKIENRESFWPGTTNFDIILEDLLSDGILKVFVLIMASVDAGAFMEAGYNAGLFKVGTQIIGTQFLVMPAVWQAMSPNAPVDKIMKGVIAITPQLVNKTESRYKSFVHRYMSQTDTKKTSPDGTVLMCSDRKDDDGGTFLHIVSKATPLGPNTCAGIEYSKLSSDDMHVMVPYAYDAVIAMAHALHHVLYTENNVKNFTGDDIKRAIINHVDFVGVTGRIQFSSGVGGIEGYGSGDRARGLVYKASVFSAVYTANGVIDAVKSVGNVGYWNNDEARFIVCDRTYETGCTVPVFNTVDGKAVDGSPDIIEIEISVGSRRLFRVYGFFGLATVGFYLFLLLLYADTRLMKASQPEIMLTVLFGGTMGSLLVLLHSFDLSDEICMSTMWLGHLAFAFTFMALLVKMWRVGKIMNSGFLRVKITVRTMLTILFAYLLLFCLILVVDTVVGRPHRGYEETFDGRHIIRLIKCTTDTPNVTRALFVFEGCIIFYGAWLCRSGKNVSTSVSDSGNVVLALYLILFVCAVTFPIVFLSIKPTPENLTVTMCVGFFVGIVGVINIVFGQKALLALEGAEVNDEMEIVRNPDAKGISVLTFCLMVSNFIRQVQFRVKRKSAVIMHVHLNVQKPDPLCEALSLVSLPQEVLLMTLGSVDQSTIPSVCAHNESRLVWRRVDTANARDVDLDSYRKPSKLDDENSKENDDIFLSENSME